MLQVDIVYFFEFFILIIYVLGAGATPAQIFLLMSAHAAALLALLWQGFGLFHVGNQIKWR
jgi:hypothetical protein